MQPLKPQQPPPPPPPQKPLQQQQQPPNQNTKSHNALPKTTSTTTKCRSNENENEKTDKPTNGYQTTPNQILSNHYHKQQNHQLLPDESDNEIPKKHMATNPKLPNNNMEHHDERRHSEVHRKKKVHKRGDVAKRQIDGTAQINETNAVKSHHCKKMPRAKTQNVLILRVDDLKIRTMCERSRQQGGANVTTSASENHILKSTREHSEHEPSENGCPKCINNQQQYVVPIKNASYFRSLDDIRNDCLNYRKTLNQYSLSFDNVSANSDIDDLGSVELVIISDEYINKSADQNVTLLKPKISTIVNGNRCKKMNKNCNKSSKPCGATAAVKSHSHKKLIVISEEFKRKSLENSVVIVNEDDLKRVEGELPVVATKSSKQHCLKMLRNVRNESTESFVDDVQNKIRSFAFKSYDEEDGEHLEMKGIQADKKRLGPKNEC